MKNPLVPRVGNRSRRENPGPGKIKLKSDRLYTIEDDVNCRNTNMIVAVVTAICISTVHITFSPVKMNSINWPGPNVCAVIAQMVLNI